MAAGESAGLSVVSEEFVGSRWVLVGVREVVEELEVVGVEVAVGLAGEFVVEQVAGQSAESAVEFVADLEVEHPG